MSAGGNGSSVKDEAGDLRKEGGQLATADISLHGQLLVPPARN